MPISLTDGVKREFSETNARPVAWLSPDEPAIHRAVESNETTWILANIVASGYYRVNYDAQNWALIDKQLKEDHSAIHPINRATLIDDAFALAGSAVLPYTTVFSLIDYLSTEDHYVPWSSALRKFSYIGRMFSYTKNYGRFKVILLLYIQQRKFLEMHFGNLGLHALPGCSGVQTLWNGFSNW